MSSSSLMSSSSSPLFPLAHPSVFINLRSDVRTIRNTVARRSVGRRRRGASPNLTHPIWQIGLEELLPETGLKLVLLSAVLLLLHRQLHRRFGDLRPPERRRHTERRRRRGGGGGGGGGGWGGGSGARHLKQRRMVTPRVSPFLNGNACREDGRGDARR